MKALKRKEGIAAIWAAVVMLLIVGFVGLAVDVGLEVWTVEQLQIVADASALAGAQFVRSDPVFARDQAQLVATQNVAGGVAMSLDRNDANEPDGDIVFGRFDRDAQTFDPEGTVNSVKVTARRTAASANGALPLHFARALGFDQVDLQRSAIAILGGGTGTGMLILDNNSSCALTIRGNPSISLNDGAIQVNSTNSCGTCLQGNPIVESSGFNMVGDACLTGVKEEDLPPLNAGQDPIPDPLATLPAPPIGSPKSPTTISGGGTKNWTPGYYPGGIDVNGGTHNLAPGIYILGGAGLKLRGSPNFYADGVMFYILSGPVDIGGSGNLRITPPDPDLYSYAGVDTYEGVAIFQARTNTATGTVIGSGTMDFQGTYYFPKNKINLGGNANNFGDQFIAWSAELFGNGSITLAVDGSIPAPGNRVFLVQ